jgi:hypothetical protein
VGNPNTDYDIASFDPLSITPKGPATLTVAPPVTGTDQETLYPAIFDFGGVPTLVVWSSAWSYPSASFQVSVARLDGTKWLIPAISDVWSGHAVYDPQPFAARSGANIAVCTGGPHSVSNSADPPDTFHYDCHLLDATSGQSSGDWFFEYPATPFHRALGLDWAADDGWLVARFFDATPSTAPTTTIRLDRLSKSGALTTDVLDVTVPRMGAGFSAFRTLAPNHHALVTPKDNGTGDATEYVTIVGCK